MIISRTPFRISFFGGGTDYPAWYLKHGGSVLSTSIDKYCYITCRTLPPFFEHSIRVVYALTEMCNAVDEIRHPAVRETLKFLKIQRGLELHHDGDLPARSGMGSSSSFTVGLLHSLYAYQGIMPGKKKLAEESIFIEQEMIKENVGSQDQVCVAYGGLNRIDFSTKGQISTRPLTLPMKREKELNDHLMLFYTGIKRTASEVVKNYSSDLGSKKKILSQMQQIVGYGIDILNKPTDICEFGELLHETWKLKKQVGSGVSNNYIDDLYLKAHNNGAIGGKITGAGGGGFLLLFVPPEKQANVREALSQYIHVPFNFERTGSQIIFYEPEEIDYSEVEKDRAKREIIAFRELETAQRLPSPEPNLR
ncbi:MAG: kinase [Phycisphaerae bacterium]|nr:kinase [Phycisphaerae bacterium]